MPRKPRNSLGGVVYHVLNRGNARHRVFFTPADYVAFLVALLQASRAVSGVRVLAWCVMPNHWHLVLWPTRDGELSDFVRRLTQAHAQRHRRAHDRVGYGSLYQGRYKSFPVQPDDAFLMLCRYVERNALRAKLVRRAADWRWCSAWVRSGLRHRDVPDDLRGQLEELLADWPVNRPRNWDQTLNEPQPDEQEKLVQRSLKRGRPLGDEKWTVRTARRMGLNHTLRPPGRPPKDSPTPARRRAARRR